MRELSGKRLLKVNNCRITPHTKALPMSDTEAHLSARKKGTARVMFQNREHAGQALAEEVARLALHRPTVLAIPRGGVVVGSKVAETLRSPLGLIMARKVGAPGNPELAVAAVAPDGTLITDERLVQFLGISRDYLAGEAGVQRREIDRRMQTYGWHSELREFAGQNIIIIDDGLATGMTMLASIAYVRNAEPASITVAVPVSAPEAAELVTREVSHFISLLQPDDFMAVGQFYQDFRQVGDDEVIKILGRHNRSQPGTE